MMQFNFLLKHSLLGFVLIVGMTTQALAKQWTLEEAIETAMLNNPDLKALNESMNDANSKVSEAWGSALPSVSLQAQYNKAFEQYTPSMPRNIFPNASPYFDPDAPDYSAPTAALAQDMGNVLGLMQSKEYTTTASVVVSQVIFAQGKISTGLNIAKSYKEVLRAQIKTNKSQIKKEIIDLFNQSLYLSEAIKIYELSITQADRHLTNVKGMYKAGMVSEIDQLQAEIQVEDLKSQREKLHKDLTLSMNALLNKMGMPYDESVELVGELNENPELPTYDEAYQTALENRQEIIQLQNYEEMQEEMVDLAKADYLPSIVAGGSFSRVSNTDEWNRFDWGNDASVFIQAQWNLFNGMQTHEKVVQARTEVSKANIQKNHLIQSIRLQIESELNQLQNTQKLLKVSQRMIELAEKNYLLSEKAYQAGNTSQLNMQDAELNLRRARLDYKKNLLQLNQSINSLKLAMGTL